MKKSLIILLLVLSVGYADRCECKIFVAGYHIIPNKDRGTAWGATLSALNIDGVIGTYLIYSGNPGLKYDDYEWVSYPHRDSVINSDISYKALFYGWGVTISFNEYMHIGVGVVRVGMTKTVNAKYYYETEILSEDEIMKVGITHNVGYVEYQRKYGVDFMGQVIIPIKYTAFVFGGYIGFNTVIKNVRLGLNLGIIF